MAKVIYHAMCRDCESFFDGEMDEGDILVCGRCSSMNVSYEPYPSNGKFTLEDFLMAAAMLDFESDDDASAHSV